MKPKEKKSRRARLRAALLSAAISSVFVLIFGNFSYLYFPKNIATFKGDRQSVALSLERVFEATPGPDENLWALEVEFFQSLREEQAFTVAVNGSAAGAPASRGKRLFMPFSSSLLREGQNSLRVASSHAWQFRRLRIKNIYGYSSGFFAAVIFPKENMYPEARKWPRAPFFLPFLIFLGIVSLALNLVSSLGTHPRFHLFRALLALRFGIPLLLLGIILFPLFTKYRIIISFQTALALIVVYYVLAYLFELTSGLERAAKGIRSLLLPAAGLIRARQERIGWKKEDWLAAVLLFGFAFICLVYPGPGPRSGDSLEYYAMLVSWAEYLKPYLTPDSCAYLESRLSHGSSPKEHTLFAQLSKKFPNLLKNGRELDLPHFWFYSLCAGVFYWPLRLFSADIGVCFSLLHIGLLVLAFFLIRRKLGTIAGLSSLLIAYFSPLLWFSNKAHTEFFTVILTILSVAFIISEDYSRAALFMALASTQNPPFAILAFLIFLFGLFKEKWALIKKHFFLWPVTGFLVVIHPLYYYGRHGFLNPVVGGGGARLGQDVFSLKKVFCFILDPDIGLFANWPLSLLLLALFVILMARKRVGLNARVWSFLILSVPILLWSQSRTGNVNHGGTIHISRYALWYLFIFFLVVWQICLFLSKTVIPSRRILAASAIAISILQLILYWPTRAEEYLRPTRASRLLYDHLPGLYNPVPEIFIERQIGRETSLPRKVWAVSNKSGNKIYVQRNRMRYKREKKIPMIAACPGLDPVLVYREAARRFAREPKRAFLYINGRNRVLKRQVELETRSP